MNDFIIDTVLGSPAQVVRKKAVEQFIRLVLTSKFIVLFELDLFLSIYFLIRDPILYRLLSVSFMFSSIYFYFLLYWYIVIIRLSKMKVVRRNLSLPDASSSVGQDGDVQRQKPLCPREFLTRILLKTPVPLWIPSCKSRTTGRAITIDRSYPLSGWVLST